MFWVKCYNNSDAVKNKVFFNFKPIYMHLFIKNVFEKEITYTRAQLSCKFFFKGLSLELSRGLNVEFKHNLLKLVLLESQKVLAMKTLYLYVHIPIWLSLS